MRVLLVTDIFPPAIGGPATFVDRLGRWLALRGHSVTVLCSSESRTDPRDDGRPFRVVRVPLANRYQYELEVRSRLLVLMGSHRRILVNGLDRYVMAPSRLLRRRFVLKVVGDVLWEAARNRGLTNADPEAFQAGASRLYPAAWRGRAAVLRRARAVVVPSEYLARLVRGWGVPGLCVHVIPNAAPVADGPAPHQAPGPGLRVSFVGRLVNWKGVETLLLAAAAADELSVSIAGDGPAGPLLESLARQLAIGDRVRFLGRCAPEQVASLLDRTDVLVLPSLYEGMSHTLLEAMSRGVPCVVSSCAGNLEVISPGVNGLVVPPGDPAYLRAILVELARDRDRLARLAAGAVARARDFSIDRMGQAYEQLVGSGI